MVVGTHPLDACELAGRNDSPFVGLVSRTDDTPLSKETIPPNRNDHSAPLLRRRLCLRSTWGTGRPSGSRSSTRRCGGCGSPQVPSDDRVMVDDTLSSQNDVLRTENDGTARDAVACHRLAKDAQYQPVRTRNEKESAIRPELAPEPKRSDDAHYTPSGYTRSDYKAGHSGEPGP